MNERLQNMKYRVRNFEHKKYRDRAPLDISVEFEAEGLSMIQRSARLTRRMCEAQTVVIEPDERIVFTRTSLEVPPLYSPAELKLITGSRTLHELGPISNICADWGMVLSGGLVKRRETALCTREKIKNDPQAVEFLDSAIETIDAVLGLASRYENAARQMGRTDLADILSRVPAEAPATFHEALQSLRLMHAVVWLSGHYHVGLGRLDQYLWPYLSADLAGKRLDLAEAEELLAEFLISLNKDTDLYPGVQQGDNGQSLMLGGVTRDGACAVNELTYMVLRAARDVAMIDPKINLRINRDTDLELLTLATELTEIGLGFPQYSNDDVVIPALAAHGYDLEDARDYTVAACWEFIIPGKGMEVVNIGAVSLPAAVDDGIRSGLAAGDDFEGVLARVADHVGVQVRDIAGSYANLFLPPAPYYSVLMHDCLESGSDLCSGLKYNNFGIHGAASSSAADALAAVKRFVFDQASLEADQLLKALDTDYTGQIALQQMLVQEGPKVGNNDDQADQMMVRLFDIMADACEEIEDNGRGGIIRPGSGSAMYYVWLSRGHGGMREPVVSATADGRRAGEFFSANLAPSAGVKVRGPVSVLQSYGKIDYQRIYNGGPITMELSDTVFCDQDSRRKVAMLVRAFAQLGCQQLQLNTLSVETLKDAMEHPDRHTNLIVRVWGWSGYFCELDREYQQHIIKRHMFLM